NDIVSVGSLAGLWETAPNAYQFIDVNGLVDFIAALLTVDGGTQNPADQLNIDDTGDFNDNVGNLTSTDITGLDMGGSIHYVAFEDLNIDLGHRNDVFTIESTHTGTTALTGRGGDDILNVRTISGDTTVAGDGLTKTITYGNNVVFTGIGDDIVNVGTRAGISGVNTGGLLSGIQAHLKVEGSGQFSIDRLNLDDTGNTIGQLGLLKATTLTGLGMAPAGILYENFELMRLGLASGNDRLRINAKHGDVTYVN